MDVESVVKKYEELESIKATSRHFGCSEGTVVKCLVTAGAYWSDRAEVVQKLHNQGLSENEIAARLGVSVSTVDKYIPYTKGTYLSAGKSTNAVRIKQHRERAKNGTAKHYKQKD